MHNPIIFLSTNNNHNISLTIVKKVVKIFVFFDLLKLGNNHRNHFQNRKYKNMLRLLVASCYQVITSCHHQYHPSTAIAYEMNLAAKKKKN